MKPIKFKEQNMIVGQGQQEYIPLPAHVSADGQVISRWQFSFLERLQVLFTGKMWLSVLSFGRPMQPIKPMLIYPFLKTKKAVQNDSNSK